MVAHCLGLSRVLLFVGCVVSRVLCLLAVSCYDTFIPGRVCMRCSVGFFLLLSTRKHVRREKPSQNNSDIVFVARKRYVGIPLQQ